MSEQAENTTYRVVTPEELGLGYVTCGKWSDPGATITHHAYRVIRELPDGNFVVANLMGRSAPRVTVRPIPIKRAISFVREVHRRLPAIQGGMWVGWRSVAPNRLRGSL